MKFTANREAMLIAAQLASQCMPSRDVKPILRNLKIVGGSPIELVASDLEIGLAVGVRGVQAEGDLLVPAGQFVNILQEATSKDVAIETDEQNAVLVRAGFSEWEMPFESADGFPDIPRISGSAHTVSAARLQARLRRCVFACARESARFGMTGILVEFCKGKLTLVATDGRRLAVDEYFGVLGDGEDTGTAQHIIPSKAGKVLDLLLGLDPEDTAVMKVSANDCLVSTSRGTLYTLLVEGRYPQWQQVLPKNVSKSAVFTANELEKAVRQVKIMVNEESAGVAVKCMTGKAVMTTNGAGRARVEMPLEYSGNEFDFRLDSRYLLDLARCLPADVKVTLEYDQKDRPVLFRWDSYRMVIMPLT